MKMMLAAVLLAFGVLAQDPAKPDLNLEFSAKITRSSPSRPNQPSQSTNYAISKKSMRVSTTQEGKPFDKKLVQIMDCKTSERLLIEPFFDETVCYKSAPPPKQPGHKGPTPEQCFTQQVEQGPMGTQMYEHASYKKTVTKDGKTIYIFANTTTRVEHGRIINPTTHKPENFTQTVTQSYSYYVTKAGDLVKVLQEESMEMKRPGQPIERNNGSMESTFEDYASPAAPGTLSPPKDSGKCNPWYDDEAYTTYHHLWNKPSLTMRVNDETVIDEINNSQDSWVAGASHYMPGKSYDEVRRSGVLGTFPMPGLAGLKLRDEVIDISSEDIPATFDAREQWKECAMSDIGKVRNQGHCGSCWAFAATESLEDRYCIATKKKHWFSVEYMVDCDTHDGGCGGGFLDNAWKYMMSTGVPDSDCDPYKYCDYAPFPNCTAPKPPAPGPKPGPPAPPGPAKCPTKCKDGSAIKAYKAKSAYAVSKPGDVETMQKELMTNGPFEVAFWVYNDFMQYKSGVYIKGPKAQGPLGGHAVKFLGWGTEGGVDYWLVANSWSPNWGDSKGFFKIRRGTNECGIETTPAAGEPDLSI